MNRSSTLSASIRCTSGFALLITITLLAFLVLLLVSLAALTRVETQVAANNQQLSEARQNALMALNIALGELQKQVGPDQRTTAPADIITVNAAQIITGFPPQPTTPIPDMSDEAKASSYETAMEAWDNDIESFWQNRNRHWTGVWANGDYPLDAYSKSPTPVFLGWLVSGAKHPTYDVSTGKSGSETQFGKVTTVAAAADGPLASDVVTGLSLATGAMDTGIRIGAQEGTLLAGKNTLGENAILSDYVVVPVIPINVPASAVPGLNGNNDTKIGGYAYWIGDEGIKAKLTMADPYSSATGVGSAEGSYRFQVAQRVSGERISGFSGLQPEEGQLSKILNSSQLQYLDSTLTANVVNQRFHDTTIRSLGVLSDSQRGGLRQDLTASLASANLTGKILPLAVSPAQGPNWEMVQSFYDLASGSGAIPVQSATPTRTGISPIMIKTRNYVYPRRAAGSNEVTMRIGIAFVLANPYTSSITASDGLDIVYRKPSDLGYTLPNLRLGLRVAGTAVFDREFISLASNLIFRIPPTTFAAGESKVFSLASDVTPTGGDGQVVMLTDDFDPTTALTMPTTATPSPSSVQWALSISATGGCDIEMRPAGRLDILQRIRNTSVWTGNGPARTIPASNGSDYDFYGSGGEIFMKNPTEGAASVDVRVYADYNLHAQVFDRPAAHGAAGRGFNGNPLYTSTASGSYITNPVLYAADFALSRWGPSTTSANGKAQFTLYDLPRAGESGQQPLLSIGQLQHADLTADDRPNGAVPSCIQPAFAVGNSWATPYVKRDQTKTTAFGETYYDISYLLNSTLWDSFYFSTVPVAGAFNPAESLRLPNGRLRFLTGALPTIAEARTPRQVAAWQLIDGGFNVNSTRLEAWRAVLGSLHGLTLNGDNNLSGPFPRSLRQHLGSVGAETGVSDEAWSGFRNLAARTTETDEKEIDRLAKNIVRQIRLRGPALSLGHFINRRLVQYTGGDTYTNKLNTDLETTISEQGLRGTLAAAIEAAGINSLIQKNHSQVVAYNAGPNEQKGYSDWRATEGSRAMAIPGWLTQADLLQPLGPTISSRSDTFLIRTYGISVNPVTQNINGRAWCEAVVQRSPDYIDSSIDRWVDPSSLVGVQAEAASQFGRRFRIVSFRWLSPGEI